MARQVDRTREEGQGADQERSEGQESVGQGARTGERTGQEAERTAQQAERRMREAQQRVYEGTHELAVMGERAFEAMLRNNNEILQRMLEMNMELATWGRETLDDSLGAFRSITQSRAIEDAFGVQARLMRTGVENSFRHSTNMFTLMTRAMLGGTQAAQQAQRAMAQEGQQSERT